MSRSSKTDRSPRRKRDDLAERRREELLEVATQRFAERSFRGTDLQDVADAAGVGKGTLYRYFPTKRDLFLAAVDRAMGRMRAAIHAAADEATEPLEQIARAVRAYLEFFAAHPELTELLIQERAEFRDRKQPTYFVHRDTQRQRWLKLFRELAAGGRLRAGVSPEQALDLLSDLLYGAMFTDFFMARRRSPPEQAQAILDLFLNGVLRRDGRET